MPGAAYSFLAFQNGVFLTVFGNRHSEFHKRLLGLASAKGCSANKGCAVEPLRVNSPSPALMPFGIITERFRSVGKRAG